MLKFIISSGLICFFFYSTSVNSLTTTQDCITVSLQPQNVLVLDNDDIELSVEAESAENLLYQWQIFDEIDGWLDLENGLDYSGVNSETLTIRNVSPLIDNTMIRVIISTVGGVCTPISSDEITIDYINLTVFNEFTPNDDGINDFFKINGILVFPESDLRIYNRWGNLIYEKKGYQNDWDGVSTNARTLSPSKKVPSGTYYYTLDLNFDNKRISGWLYINR